MTAVLSSGTAALTATAHLLRDVAHYEQRTDASRGDVSLAQAALLDAVAHHLDALPAVVVARALAVVDAVDRATGNRRAG
jgi:hypothetical protein